MKPLKLSRRLDAVAQMVKAGERLADIGSDHGQLIISLCESGKISQGYAVENKPGPYAILEQAIRDHHREHHIVTELADGISRLPQTIDTVVIAGMGGELIASILKSRPERLKNVKSLILAPNTEAPLVRQAVVDLHFTIVEETMIHEKHDYEIIRAIQGASSLTEADILYGPLLRKEKSAVFLAKYQARLRVIDQLMKKPLSLRRLEALSMEKERLLSL
jgi:tRNA (adenine22-N1)-methyltransferase